MASFLAISHQPNSWPSPPHGLLPCQKNNLMTVAKPGLPFWPATNLMAATTIPRPPSLLEANLMAATSPGRPSCPAPNLVATTTTRPPTFSAADLMTATTPGSTFSPENNLIAVTT
jgi:hypothetical protein